jgi:hypothetical protein
MKRSGGIVSAGMIGVAAADALQRAPESAPDAVLADGVDRILRTGGGEPACVRRQKGGKQYLVSPQHRNNRAPHEGSADTRAAHCLQSARISSCTAARGSLSTLYPGRPRNMMTMLIVPDPAADRREAASASKAARIRRRILFLFTAVKVLLETEKPARSGVPAPRSYRKKHRRRPLSSFVPCSNRAENAPRPRSVSSFFTYRSSLTVSFLRPRARLRERTFRPFFVAIRARNPCVFFRFRLWG